MQAVSAYLAAGLSAVSIVASAVFRMLSYPKM